MKSHNRRAFIQQIAAGSAGVALSTGLSACEQPAPDPMPNAPTEPTTSRVYIGTYTRGASEGIYYGLFDHATGALNNIQLAIATLNPSYLTVLPSGTGVIAVNEVSDFNGERTGAISGFNINEDGSLRLINQQITRGGAPCYVSTDKAGRWAFIANYGGGSVSVFPIGTEGDLSEASSFIQHEGSSVNERRQEAPHAHCMLLDPSGSYAFAADLGIDKVMIYAFDNETGVLTPNSPSYVATDPGAGPRHFTFHPNGRYAFVINELDSTITSFAFEASTGALSPLDTRSTLPDAFTGNNSCADIHVHPNGRFVYGSNRGHDSIAIMAFDEATGGLSLLGNESTQGQTPRNFTLDPSGAFLLVANQQSDSIVSFRIDTASGMLEATGHVAEVPTPVCLKF